MHFNLEFADVPLEARMVVDFASLVEMQERTLVERAREHIWLDVDKTQDDERQIGYYQENLLEEGIALRFLTAASIISAWAAYEATVVRMAEYLEKKKGASLKFSDLRGALVNKARKYFADVLGADLHPKGTDWSRLAAVGHLRHAYAHGNGRLADVTPSRRKKITNIVKATHGLTNEGEYIIISARYAREAAEFMQGLINELIDRLAPVFMAAKDT